MDFSAHFSGWPVENVSAALVGPTEASLGDEGRIYELKSVTKLISAYSFLMAVEEGAFTLDDACGPPGSTVRHLLAHASGVGFDTREPQKPVGQRRIYSSAGFEVLADFLEESTGMGLAEYARLGVFEPLGMDTAEIYGSAGHGGRASLSDMRAFARELASPTLISQSTLADAFSNQFGDLRGIVPGYGMHKPCPWGLGFEVKGDKAPHWMGENMPPDTVGHFGMSGTYLWVVPAWSSSAHAGTALVVLTDRDFGDWAKPLWAETNAAVFARL